MNNRRELLIALDAALSMPRAVLAQSTKQPVVIGWLAAFPRDAVARRFVAFMERMAAFGWKEGADYIIEDRWLEGGYQGLQSLAQDLAGKKPAVVFAAPSQGVAAAAEAAPNTPIVTAGGNPASVRQVSNPARPGGTTTGVSNDANEIFGKRVELMLDAVGKGRRIGILVDPQSTRKKGMERFRREVAQRSIEVHFAWADRAEDIELAVTGLAKEGCRHLSRCQVRSSRASESAS